MKTMITITTQNETKNFLGSLIAKASIALVLTSTITLSTLAGPISDGGGNSINYKLIQSYQAEVTKSDAIKTLNPALQNLKVKLPNMYNRIIQTLKNTTFYIVPKKMKSITSEYTGLPFQSDQIAVNKLKTNEVFIDADIFSKMSLNEKGRLFLHETLEYITLKSLSESYIEESMSFVRRSTNTITQEFSLDAQTLANELKTPLLQISVPKEFAELFYTAEQVDQVNLAKEKRAKEIIEMKSQYKEILDVIFLSVDSYCKNAGHLGITEHQVANELNSSEENLLISELSKFDPIIKMSYQLGIQEIKYSHEQGFKVSDFQNINYSSDLKDFSEYYLKDLIQNRYTAPIRFSSLDLKQIRHDSKLKFRIYETAHTMYKFCINLPAQKIKYYSHAK